MINRQPLQTTLDCWAGMLPSQLHHKWMKAFKEADSPEENASETFFLDIPGYAGVSTL